MGTFIRLRNENENETRLVSPRLAATRFDRFGRFGRFCRLRLAKCYTRSSMPQIKCDQFGQTAAAATATATATEMAALDNEICMQKFVKGQPGQSVNQPVCQSVSLSIC